MRGKKVLDFIILRPVFNLKNFKSIGIVLILMGGYSLFGGQVPFRLPAIQNTNSLDVPVMDSETSVPAPAALPLEEAKQVLGIDPTEEQAARNDSVTERNPVASKDSKEDTGYVNPELHYNFDQQNRRIESKLQANERRKKDTMDVIQERLKYMR